MGALDVSTTSSLRGAPGTSPLIALGRLWARRETGVLLFHSHEGAGGLSLVALLACGAFVCDEGPRILEESARGGEVSLTPAPVDAVGDWERTGEAIFSRAREAGSAGPGPEFFGRSVRWSEDGEAAWALPVIAELSLLAPALEGADRLVDVLPSQGQGRACALSALAALWRMGLVEVAEVEQELAPAHVADLERLMETLAQGDAVRAPGAIAMPFLLGHPLERRGTKASMEEQERLLSEGRRLLLAQEWAAADRVLCRARDLRVDCAPVLASLAQARANNPALPREIRSQDARQLLALARALAPDGAEAVEVAPGATRAGCGGSALQF